MPSPSALRSLLLSRGGAMRWRDWMEAALYDPLHGYYTANIRTVGPRGDFSTSATLGPALAAAIAAWIMEEWRRAGGAPLPLIEIGAGDGSLHAGVLRALGGWWARRRVRSHIVERSPVLCGVQQEKLRPFRRRITWHPDMTAALTACEGRAILFSNELADAFPATLLQWHGGAWQEVWLCITPEGGIVEELRPATTGPAASGRLTFPDGQRIEVLDSWREWLHAWRPHWKAGAMLTVDYGGTAAEIYHRRPAGTVRGYRRHQRLDATELYAATGLCDVTVDVNFDDLREWGEAAGLTTAGCVSQREFTAALTTISDAVQPGDGGGAAEFFRCLSQRPA